MPKILVVDDEKDIVASVKRGLESRGFDVDAYIDPLVALENFKPGIYDLLLLDIKMPKMNGFQLYKEIRKRDDGARICFMTAYDLVYREEFKKAFPELEENRFISKPATLSDLITRISAELNENVIT